MIYLSHPIAHHNEHIVNMRVDAATCAAAYMVGELGLIVFCTGAHTRALRQSRRGLNWDHEQYLSFDLCLLRHFHYVHILHLPGVDKSEGVALERKEATRLGIPVRDILNWKLFVPEMYHEVLERY